MKCKRRLWPGWPKAAAKGVAAGRSSSRGCLARAWCEALYQCQGSRPDSWVNDAAAALSVPRFPGALRGRLTRVIRPLAMPPRNSSFGSGPENDENAVVQHARG
uniref:Uncharacterized protein n=1 Tax=Apteryx owenii TaxID=8824 RepID=A0A8B9SBR1_APTOW